MPAMHPINYQKINIISILLFLQELDCWVDSKLEDPFFFKGKALPILL